MPSRRIAPLSDLHAAATTDESLQRLVRAVLRSGADHVAITGDVTHRGRAAELERFRRAFAPLLGNGRAVIVPGNHDRLGDDLEAELMPGERVQVSAARGLWMVRCNSTGPHNRRWWDSHGLLRAADLDAVAQALDSAPAGATRVLLLHHHLLPLPEEDLFERLVSRLGWPNAAELPAFRIFDVDGRRVDTCWIDARAEDGASYDPPGALPRAA